MLRLYSVKEKGNENAKEMEFFLNKEQALEKIKGYGDSSQNYELDYYNLEDHINIKRKRNDGVEYDAVSSIGLIKQLIFDCSMDLLYDYTGKDITHEDVAYKLLDIMHMLDDECHIIGTAHLKKRG